MGKSGKSVPMAKGAKLQKKAVNKAAASKSKKASKEEVLKVTKRSPRVERALKKLEPQVVEFSKQMLILKGHATSECVCEVLSDINMLSKPNAKMMQRKNDILPFEDANSLEFLATKNDCSLFTLANHTKKRPNNLIVGRLFDGHILDMVEFGIVDHKSLSATSGPSKALGSKPLIVFQGDKWNTDPVYERIEGLLLDLFRGEKTTNLALKGIDHVLSFSVVDDRIYMRGYFNKFIRSGTKIPNIDLHEMGPSLELEVRRTQLASEEMRILSMKRPKGTAPKKVKNVVKTALGEKIGRIHMKKQDLDTMNSRRVTALRNGGSGAGGTKSK